MPGKKKTAILIRCTPETAAKIREAAQAERRSLSEFVLNAVLYELPLELPNAHFFTEEMANELAQACAELGALLAEGLDLRQVLCFAYRHHADYAAASLGRARQRLAQAQRRLNGLSQQRRELPPPLPEKQEVFEVLCH